jgi:shikimate dehydrogenase
METHFIVVNTTPTGTFPNVGESPQIPYGRFTPRHIAYDLIYNPAETAFLQKAKARGAAAKNGLEMLRLQAEAAWKIWNP